MKLRRGDIVKKKMGGGTKRAEVLRVAGGHAFLRPLATSATKRRSAVTSLRIPLDDRGAPDGYEVVR